MRASMVKAELRIRPARPDDAVAAERLRSQAVRRLCRDAYGDEEIAALVASFATLDPRLIADGTYYVATLRGELVGCGDWSYRAARYGAAQAPPGELGELDPTTDRARIRGFFTHPDWAGLGIARRIVAVSEWSARQAGFCAFDLHASLNAEPVYRALDYRSAGHCAIVLPNGLRVRSVYMVKTARNDGDKREAHVTAAQPSKRARTTPISKPRQFLSGVSR